MIDPGRTSKKAHVQVAKLIWTTSAQANYKEHNPDTSSTTSGKNIPSSIASNKGIT